MTKPDPRDDKKFAAMCQWLKKNGLEAHTKLKGDPLIICRRTPRKSRLTGEAR